MEKYYKEFIIPYYDCNKTGEIKIVSLLEYLVETSSLHSDYLGLGFKELIVNNYGWILSRWKLKIYNYPKAQEKIKISTWTSNFNKFYANREFSVYDENNNLLVKASTLWVFMDTNRKRPIRIPLDLYNNYKIIENKNFKEFLNFTNKFNSDSAMDFRVRKNDIDYNNHVNNAKYINWILELIPLKVDEAYILEELDIFYKKEIKYDSMISSEISRGNLINGKLEYYHEIYNKDVMNLTTNARTIWRKK